MRRSRVTMRLKGFQDGPEAAAISSEIFVLGDRIRTVLGPSPWPPAAILRKNPRREQTRKWLADI